MKHVPQYPSIPTKPLSDILRSAIEEDSNREQMWLWVADIVDNQQERRYCLQRVLYINPANWQVRREVAAIAKDNRRKRSMRVIHPFWYQPVIWFRSLARMIGTAVRLNI